MLDAVGLDPENAERRPHEFSGGQCQRISIARAVITEPKLIICDEPVSALDVSVQAQILNLLEEMKVRYGLTMIFIAHDLAVVKNVSDRVAVMYLGKICEVGDARHDVRQPGAPVHRGAARGDPRARPRRHARTSEQVLGGEIPSPMNPPSGCRFRTRCPKAQEQSAAEEPSHAGGRPRASTWPATSRSSRASRSTSPKRHRGSMNGDEPTVPSEFVAR